MRIKLINFKDGVYLHGQVKQTVGCGLENNQGALGVTGVTQVEKLEPFDNGVVISMSGRDFFVPWTSVASCELHKDAAPVNRDLASLSAVAGKGK